MKKKLKNIESLPYEWWPKSFLYDTATGKKKVGTYSIGKCPDCGQSLHFPNYDKPNIKFCSRCGHSLKRHGITFKQKAKLWLQWMGDKTYMNEYPIIWIDDEVKPIVSQGVKLWPIIRFIVAVISLTIVYAFFAFLWIKVTWAYTLPPEASQLMQQIQNETTISAKPQVPCGEIQKATDSWWSSFWKGVFK